MIECMFIIILIIGCVRIRYFAQALLRPNRTMAMLIHFSRDGTEKS